MSIIYQPSGKAREYSPLAINIYSGCNHGCLYCYAPAIRRCTRDNYIQPEARRNIIREIERDAKKFYACKSQVLFCFMTDPYNSLDVELKLTREALEIMLASKIPVSILSKAGRKTLRDIDIFKNFGEHIQVGATLTFWDKSKSRKWEPNAATPKERIETLLKLKQAGIRTWASFEPVIEPAESLAVMKESLPVVDFYKVGKLNNYQGLDKLVDWTDFLSQVVKILRAAKKPFYIKHDLRLAAPSVKLFGNETNMDEHNLPPFQELF